MADEETPSTEQSQDEVKTEQLDAVESNPPDETGSGAVEGSAAGEEPQPVVEVMEPPDTENEEQSEEQKAGEEQKEEEKPAIETYLEDENASIPENEGIPEVDSTPALEVAEYMSREGTPTDEVDTTVPIEGPDATITPPPATPSPEPIQDDFGYDDSQIQYIDNENQMYDEEEEYYDDSEPEEPLYNRQELMEKYHQALEERSSLQSLNAQLQHKLAEYFKKKKSDERQQEIEKSVTDQEQRYLKYMSNLEELQNEEKREKENYKIQTEDLKAKCHVKEQAVEESSTQFSKFKFEIAKQAINSRSGRPIPPKDIEQYQSQEVKKELEVTGVRLENIKLRNRLKKREMQLKAKEELAEGLHLIDFEQLKIENQTYNEKIEERNEELLKLRKKITTTVQVLTHLKEKLQFVQAENGDQRNNLRSVEALAAQKRDILTRTKQVRDALRIENVKLRQKCGLLGNEPLLRDYELRKDQSDDLSSSIEKLKMDHAELTMNCAGVRQKIDEARQDQ